MFTLLLLVYILAIWHCILPRKRFMKDTAINRCLDRLGSLSVVPLNHSILLGVRLLPTIQMVLELRLRVVSLPASVLKPPCQCRTLCSLVAVSSYICSSMHCTSWLNHMIDLYVLFYNQRRYWDEQWLSPSQISNFVQHITNTLSSLWFFLSHWYHVSASLILCSKRFLGHWHGWPTNAKHYFIG